MTPFNPDSMRRFIRLSQGRKTALVCSEHAREIGAALLDAQGCVPVHMGGRGAVSRFPYAAGTGIVRRYRRGGWMRRFSGDAYLLQNRAQRELAVHACLYEQGLAVPEPLGACWERRGLLFRGAFATREIVGAASLAVRLAESADGRDDLLRAVGGLIRDLHDRGGYHADLQVGNVLCAPAGLFLIDFDNARLMARVSKLPRARNLFRFRRSMEKNGMPKEWFVRVCEGYGEVRLPRWLDGLYRLKGALSTRLTRRPTPREAARDR